MKIIAAALLALTTFCLRVAQPAAMVTLRAPAVVQVGAAWSIEVNVSDTAAGERVTLMLFSGLDHFAQTVVTGTGGVARWDLPQGMITQAGEALIIGRYGDEETRRTVRVLPGRATEADLITTANALLAYGNARGTLIALLRDSFGNPPRSSTETLITITYPNGETVDFTLPQRVGLSWTPFESQGSPGRVRAHVQADQAEAALELRQMPGEAARITLEVSPSCTASDGRDTIHLSAEAEDAHGFPVVDGTLIRFAIGDGFALGRTANGTTAIGIPAPTEMGLHRFRATSGSAQSAVEWLRITDGVCP
ncbi:MAG: hypothetical protein U0670_13795 [Anaerolineae bacterium]